MKQLLTMLAVAALMLGAAAPGWAQSGPPAMSSGYCNRSTGDIADCLNRGIADRNDAPPVYYGSSSYGSSGVTRYDTIPTVPTTTTTTSTTYSRTISPPPYPGASR
jgi:hypothetical protein